MNVEAVMHFLGLSDVHSITDLIESGRGFGISVREFVVYMGICWVTGWELSRRGLASIERVPAPWKKH